MRGRLLFCALFASGLVIWLTMPGAGHPPGRLRAVAAGLANCSGKAVSTDGSTIAVVGTSPYCVSSALLIHDLSTGQATDIGAFLPPNWAIVPLSPGISGDGCFVAFMAVDETTESRLKHIMVFDRHDQSLQLVGHDPDVPAADCFCTERGFSHDGGVLVFSCGPTNDRGSHSSGDTILNCGAHQGARAFFTNFWKSVVCSWLFVATFSAFRFSPQAPTLPRPTCARAHVLTSPTICHPPSIFHLTSSKLVL